MSEKQALIDRIDLSWSDLMASMDGLTAQQASEPGVSGEWSVKDLMNHVAYWDNQARLAAEHYLAGGDQRRLDWDALNAADYLGNRDRPFDESYNRMLATHDSLMTFLNTLDTIEPRWVSDDTWDHYPDHTSQILDWRKSTGY